MNSLQIQLYEVDVEAGLAGLAPGSVDCIVTSPPYNIGTKYNQTPDTMERRAYLAWCGRWLLGCYQALRPAGSLFLNIAGKPTDPCIPHDVLGEARPHFHLQNEIHWVKSITIGEHTAGHFKPINSPRFLNDCHEFIFHLTKSGNVPIDRLAIGVPYQDPSNIERWVQAKKNPIRCRGNCWHIPYPTRREKLVHPATFPVDLPGMCLALHGAPPPEFGHQFLALDPFIGSGTTAVAAAMHGVRCIGFDLDRSYLESARDRLQAEFGNPVSIEVGAPESSP